MSAGLIVALLGCANPRSPETLAGQRLEVGDQRLIGYPPPIIHGPSFAVVGVRCQSLGFPIQLLEPSRDVATARRELAFAARFNHAMIVQPYYTAAQCEPFGSEDDWGLGSAVDESGGRAPLPPTETFDAIFGFPAP